MKIWLKKTLRTKSVEPVNVHNKTNLTFIKLLTGFHEKHFYICPHCVSLLSAIKPGLDDGNRGHMLEPPPHPHEVLLSLA